MATSSIKDPQIAQFLDNVALNHFGVTRTAAISQDICVMCKKPATEFADALSQKEYTISGLCQVCQNDVFGGPVREEY